MAMIIDTHKTEALAREPFRPAGPEDLWRKGSVFFVGGNLPLYETLQTMFESFCMESTQLFHLTFGEQDKFQDNLEMARQIKKNFNARLIAQLHYPVSKAAIEHIYAAGVDILDIPMVPTTSVKDEENRRRQESLQTAQAVFPRWSAVSTVIVGEVKLEETVRAIDDLLNNHILPLALISSAGVQDVQAQSTIFNHLAAGWEQHQVPIQPLLPLIFLTTPLILEEQPGRIRGFINRILDRHDLVRSDLNRHLRVGHAADSLDSAGL